MIVEGLPDLDEIFLRKPVLYLISFKFWLRFVLYVMYLSVFEAVSSNVRRVVSDKLEML